MCVFSVIDFGLSLDAPDRKRPHGTTHDSTLNYKAALPHSYYARTPSPTADSAPVSSSSSSSSSIR